MKCWICGAEMTHTVGGCYHCDNCHMAAVDDGVLRYPPNFKYVGEKAQGVFRGGDISVSSTFGSSMQYTAEIKKDQVVQGEINKKEI